MGKETCPEYPIFGESLKEYISWHRSRFDSLPNEADIKQWRKVTFPNISALPLAGFEIPVPN